MTSPYPAGRWAPSLRGQSPLPKPYTHFERTPASDAVEPPEAHGVARDGVKLMIATPRGIAHARFTDLGEHLAPGDLLVVNNSATLPAAVTGARAKRGPIAVHFSAALDDHIWVVELRKATKATGHLPDVEPGERISLPDGAALVVIGSYPQAGVMGSRLWTARLAIEGDVTSYLDRHGRPIRYGYVPRSWPLSSYQTVFARRPGSAEMASAARPFSVELVTSLVSAGIVIAPITLHAGVSSAEQGEPPAAEPFEVPPATARLTNMTRAAGGRVIAVGTTATRAVESAADPDGTVHAATGWTDLVLESGRPPRVVDGLITGWHDAGASHLLLLEAVAGRALVAAAYREAIAHGYLWHEFGDSALLLPNPPRSR
jgi:S-adenosylmethionine:tRNA ribosyltransferase-isomerase